LSDPLRSLATALGAGNLSQAGTHARRVLAAGGRDVELPELLGALAAGLIGAGQPGQAREFVDALLQITPGSATAANLAGALAEGEGRGDEAIRWYREAHAANPGYRGALKNLARALRLQGDYAGAGPLARQLVAEAPEYAGAWLELGALEQALGRLAEASGCFEKALALEPDSTAARTGLAEILDWQGDTAGALRVLADAPAAADPEAHLLQARLIGRQDPAAGRTRVESLLAEPVTPWVGSRAGFVLGGLCERLGDYPAAFAAWQQANDLRRRSFDANAHWEFAARLEAAYAADDSKLPRNPDADPRPVFIVGMPRSGTSLLEQMLAAHPRIHAGGERPDIGRIAGILDWPGSELEISPQQLQSLAAQYLARLPCGDALRCTDKMPMNFQYLGLVAQLLPGARIIHCRRDPMDTGLSCFATDFADPALAFSDDLEQIGQFYLYYTRLMKHWLEVLDLPSFELDYEELVAEPEPLLRRLLEFLGLEWAPDCLHPERVERAVHTASHVQVRQPVYRHAVGRHRNFATYLGALREILESRRGDA
jgi:tetratricopeptide (TPR) repeat protein